MPSATPPVDRIEPLLALMRQLRHPQTGCPWDIEQTFATIAPYTIEEAYEVADAIARDDMAALKDELGDLLFQVAFHARMAEDAGRFDFNDVVSAICAKMHARHPHVFGDAARPDWETLKADERARNHFDSALDGVALALPALMRAEKIQKRAARTGFDWPDPAGAYAKIIEEIDEVKSATSDKETESEIGDLLFAVVNWARKLGVEPEGALRGANAKFERRFKGMEARAGDAFSGLSLDQMEALWLETKRDHP